MPRRPDPDLEDRILNAAQALWTRGGERSLTMRGVARAAGTNTPTVYRRFKDRQDLIRAILRRTISRLRRHFEAGQSLEDMAEAYVDEALRLPHEYELFYAYGYELLPPKGPGRPRPIRESRPNFALLEVQLAKRLGGSPQDHTRLALALWATLHGTVQLLLSKSIPEGHETELRAACSLAVKTLIGGPFDPDGRPERRKRSKAD
ncbi:MAG TPA: TetR/AcrR family transcriptional regulator [Bryobacteraceae bacterium]|jgi:AcrR family transcriptional regulator|nr:TetR/AcrR family transcriptional regulator [Bryobacteraceae bacterium]